MDSERMSRSKSRRIRVREIINRTIPKIANTSKFTTHEMLERIQEMTPIELVGIDKAKTVLKHLDSPVTLAMFLRGHPAIMKHRDGVVNITAYKGERTRSQQWKLKAD